MIITIFSTEAQRSGEIFSDHFTSFKDFSALLEMTMDLGYHAKDLFLAFPSAKARPSFTQSKRCCFIRQAPTARHSYRSVVERSFSFVYIIQRFLYSTIIKTKKHFISHLISRFQACEGQLF